MLAVRTETGKREGSEGRLTRRRLLCGPLNNFDKGFWSKRGEVFLEVVAINELLQNLALGGPQFICASQSYLVYKEGATKSWFQLV